MSTAVLCERGQLRPVPGGRVAGQGGRHKGRVGLEPPRLDACTPCTSSATSRMLLELLAEPAAAEALPRASDGEDVVRMRHV